MIDAYPTIAIKRLLDSIDDIRSWLDPQLNQLKLSPSTERVRTSAALFNLALEHHYAILRLIEIQLIGSAFALLRVQYEATLRGLWIARCATDSQIEQFLTGKPVKLSEIAEAVDRFGSSSGPFSGITRGSVPMLHSFTHGGSEQVKRFTNNNRLESNFPESEILAALGWSLSVSVIAAAFLSGGAGNTEIAEKLLAKAAEVLANRAA